MTSNAGLERGASLGRYLVLDRLGQGGMGVVYAAYDPELDRRLAVKLLRPDAGAAQAETRRTRLQREAQAMARLSHPNVITVHDVGTAGDQVFVAMELVDGVTLKRWLAGERRSWREVLALFIQAGRGLAAAHEAGLVHRDFKPDNVLVGKDGIARVTDFGLARPAGQEETGDTPSPSPGALGLNLTETGAILGTPAYMAPEQHRGRPVDARSDQFAFCVALYEALYDEHPFRPQVSETTSTVDAASPEAAATLSPSEALALDVVEGRIRPAPRDHDVPAWLRRAVVRGLAPSPEERWPSMQPLLAALSTDPAAARRRLLFPALLALVTAGGTVAIYAGLRGESGARDPCGGASDRLTGVWDVARRKDVTAAFATTHRPYAADLATRVDRTLDGYATRWTAMHREACLATRVRGEQSDRVLDLRMRCLDRRLSELRALAQILSGSPDGTTIDRALSAAQNLTPIQACADTAALEAARPPPDDPVARRRIADLEERLDDIAALRGTGAFAPALGLAALAVAQARLAGHPATLARALFLLAQLRADTGDAKGSDPILYETIRVAAEAQDDELAARAWSQLIFSVGQVQRRGADAMALMPAAEAAVIRAGKPKLRITFDQYVALVLKAQGKFRESEEILRRAVATGDQTLDAKDDVALASIVNSWGNVLADLGKYDEATAAYERALAMRENALGPNHPYVAASLNNLGNLFYNRNQYPEARERLEKAVAIWEMALGREHPDLASGLNNLGNLANSTGRHEDALALHRRTLAIREKAFGPEHPDVANSVNNIGLALMEMNRYPEARPYVERGLAIREKVLGKDHLKVASSLNRLGDVFAGEGKCVEAIPLYERAIAIIEAAVGRDHSDVWEPLLGLGGCLRDGPHPQKALPPLERLLALQLADGTDPTGVAMTRFALARALRLASRDPARGRKLAEEARARFKEEGEEAAKDLAAVTAWLAE